MLSSSKLSILHSFSYLLFQKFLELSINIYSLNGETLLWGTCALLGSTPSLSAHTPLQDVRYMKAQWYVAIFTSHFPFYNALC